MKSPILDDIVEETTDQVAADKGILRCAWRNILDQNLKGNGTSFIDRPVPQNQDCWDCKGYETGCDLYLPSKPDYSNG